MNLNSSIAAVIPVHNRADLLAQLLDSMDAQTLPFSEIIVVDNASTDGAGELARERGCRVITQNDNEGFARAVNIGWQTAGNCEWIALLNSDVTLDPAWLEILMAGAADFSFAAGTIFNAADRGVVDGTYDLMCRSGCAWRAGHGESAARMRPRSVIAAAPGTACLIRRETLRHLHGFDEQFGSYLEDVDFGLRCLNAGYSGVYIPEAHAWHHGSATLGRWNPAVVRLISRNQLLLVRRHFDRELFHECFWPMVAGQALWGLVALRHGAFFAWLSGKWDALRSFRPEGRPSAALRAFLTASENEIRTRATGWYWRWYFRLTSPFRNVPKPVADRPGAAH